MATETAGTIDRTWNNRAAGRRARCIVVLDHPGGPIHQGYVDMLAGAGWEWTDVDGNTGEVPGDYLDAEDALLRASGGRVEAGSYPVNPCGCCGGEDVDVVGWCRSCRHFIDDDCDYAAWCAKQDARGELAGAPEALGCHECGGFDGVTAPVRQVVAVGPVVNPGDPTQSYRMDCGHLVI